MIINKEILFRMAQNDDKRNSYMFWEKSKYWYFKVINSNIGELNSVHQWENIENERKLIIKDNYYIPVD